MTYLGICEKDDALIGSDQRADIDILVLVIPENGKQIPHKKRKMMKPRK